MKEELRSEPHAVLQGRWTKGRDLFDLFWYLSDPTWPDPNLVLLNNALGQTASSRPPLTESSWRSVVRDRVASLDWQAAEQDGGAWIVARRQAVGSASPPGAERRSLTVRSQTPGASPDQSETPRSGRRTWPPGRSPAAA